MSGDHEEKRQKYIAYDEKHYLALDKATKAYNVLASSAVILCATQEWKMVAIGLAASVVGSTFLGIQFSNAVQETREPYYSPRNINYKKAAEPVPVTAL